ncbi:MAG: Isoprenyl transferase [Candidatus Yanofskybacteria bacterium GW2011_GWA1_48_10]|uniref:Isoprenyl transferase n=1 Tax=Candidatus Yanofskybacteria bacterium GW2011_GWA1_48_10 TaxID=1619022 RepID=A0A0G1X607_9BACT|nr:MAG: Isoprenyl transferase [Candidatus Yanofskybacteria bacterium GW2011_GWA1_48_10]
MPRPQPPRTSVSLPPGTVVPNHLAIILDGNRRWARSKGLDPWEGHKAGYLAGKKIAEATRRWGIHTLTVWGFSTENWERNEKEISTIMDLLRRFLAEVREEVVKEDTRFVHLGDKQRLPEDIVAAIKNLEEETRFNKRHVLNVALNYGGRNEIVRTTQKIIDADIPAEQVDEKLFASYLDTADQPYPYVDLFIRPSGEQRTSGLLPWQMTYAEYYWELDHLPDMTPEKLKKAIMDYSCRRRRFGGNDKEEHFKFDPALVAKLELDWRRALDLGEGERLRDLVVRYVKEHYGLSKELAKDAGYYMAKALLYGRSEDWDMAKESLKGLYAIIQKTLGLAMEPEVVAGIQIDGWRRGKVQPSKTLEEHLRQLYAEVFRVSDFQASKAAHLAALAQGEMDKKNWDLAEPLLERFYRALKERVA